MKLLRLFLFCLVIFLGVISVVTAAPISQVDPPDFYVKAITSGAADCSSWADACGLQTALSRAASGNEIRVAAGTYYPSNPEGRSATFALVPGVAIFGGFPDTGVPTWEDRNWNTNPTILSGDLNADDGTNFTNRTDNSYHVVKATWVTNTAILDGFTIIAGNANGTTPNHRGGGLYIRDASPTLTNLIISDNSAALSGGGMDNDNANPTLSYVDFSGNHAQYGGGIYTERSGALTSNPILTNVTFSDNTAEYGGGMYIQSNSNPMLTNVTFSGNTALLVSASSGGGLYNLSNSTLTNVTFSTNSAVYGGGMYTYFSSPTLKNVTFTGNTATSLGGAVLNGGSFTLINGIVWGNTTPQIQNNSGTLTITYSDIQGWTSGGTGNIDSDPLLGSLASNGGFTNTHALGTGSPAIDAGDPSNCPSTDQRGFDRPIDGDTVPGAVCDMGAFEFDTYSLSLVIMGNGQVSKNPDKSSFLYGEEVILTPVADAGWVFDVWSGSVSSSDNPLTVKIINDTTITASFAQEEYTLTTSVNPTGYGIVTSSTTPAHFHYGDSVTLTANANPGYAFVGWSGDATGTVNPLEVTIQGNTSITADFQQGNFKIYLPSVLK